MPSHGFQENLRPYRPPIILSVFHGILVTLDDVLVASTRFGFIIADSNNRSAVILPGENIG